MKKIFYILTFLSVSICSLSQQMPHYSLYMLNDIVINHGNSGRILKTEVLVSNKYLNTYESDGLIFSGVLQFAITGAGKG